MTDTPNNTTNNTTNDITNNNNINYEREINYQSRKNHSNKPRFEWYGKTADGDVWVGSREYDDFDEDDIDDFEYEEFVNIESSDTICDLAINIGIFTLAFALIIFLIRKKKI
jgi:hypothetical protein